MVGEGPVTGAAVGAGAVGGAEVDATGVSVTGAAVDVILTLKKTCQGHKLLDETLRALTVEADWSLGLEEWSVSAYTT